MMPSARLTQASFADLDLILADNFGRAAARAGVEHIIYVGGLTPSDEELSAHLESRCEVERALGAYGVRVTALRAALVVGPGGSSFRILRRLVERLPVMLCPKWTQTPTQPISIDDLVEIIAGTIERREVQGQVYDVGGPDVVTYQQMIADVAELLGKKRRLFPVPAVSPAVSRLWVSTVTGAPRSLVYPLVQSLRHEMVARDRRLQEKLGLPGRPWRKAARFAIHHERSPERVSTHARSRRRMLGKRRTVRSIQRLPRPPGATAEQIAHEYLRWLPVFLRHLLVVDVEDQRASFRLRFMRRPLLLLEFVPHRSSEDRAVFRVTGGLLTRSVAQQPGRLEFRTVPGGDHLLAAVHDFVPALPWYVYLATQALVHVAVMRRFGSHLSKVQPHALSAQGRDRQLLDSPA